MGRTVYEKCVELLKQHSEEVLTLDKLSSLIMISLGGDVRTIKNALHVMALTGLIEDMGNSRFKIK